MEQCDKDRNVAGKIRIRNRYVPFEELTAQEAKVLMPFEHATIGKKEWSRTLLPNWEA